MFVAIQSLIARLLQRMHVLKFHSIVLRLLPVVVVSATIPLKLYADVSALGRIEPRNGIAVITAPAIPEAGINSVLNQLHVSSGDYVQSGQLLAVTEAGKLLTSMRDQAVASHDLAKAQASAADAVADAACVLADVTRREAERRDRLLQQKLSSQEESERAYADATFQDATCEASRMTAVASSSMVGVALSAVEMREVALGRASIFAPMAGRVLTINTWPGEMIGAEGILELGDVEHMYAIAEIYETDIGRVDVGQKARITSGALAEALTGVVEHIRPLIRKQDVMGTDPAARKDARVVEVEVLIDNPKLAEALSNLQVEILIVGS
jgi:HlyD family secretion protein